MKQNPTANFNSYGKAGYDDPRLMMAPPGAERWYDGEPKRGRGKMFRLGDPLTSLWLIRVVVSDPSVQVDHG